jgi:hypothetical protein
MTTGCGVSRDESEEFVHFSPILSMEVARPRYFGRKVRDFAEGSRRADDGHPVAGRILAMNGPSSRIQEKPTGQGNP